MATYLLTYNPDKWYWIDLLDDIAAVERGDNKPGSWSCSNQTKIVKGDRFFLLKQGKPPRGIMGSGTVVSENVITEAHWIEEFAAKGITSNYVEIVFDALLDPETTSLLPREMLDSPPFNKTFWNTQRSGIVIEPGVALELDKVWKQHVQSFQFQLPEEIEESVGYSEGAIKQVTVNAYERNSRARQACIEYYGTTCCVCGFNFIEKYGDQGRDYIHVHHITSIATKGKEYQIDPVRDLRPICPNCHAMIHRWKPNLTIEKLRTLLR